MTRHNPTRDLAHLALKVSDGHLMLGTKVSGMHVVLSLRIRIRARVRVYCSV